ncbi:MAG: AAA family ATPase [bacterium]|nr:AAA family ATPase [bacterium]
MLILDDISKTLIAILSKWDAKGMDRREKVLRLLKLLEPFGPGQLKKDYRTIYVHALVEFAVEAKPMELVRLFGQNDVYEAFLGSRGKDEHGILYEALAGALTKGNIPLLNKIYTSATDLAPEVKRFSDHYDSLMLLIGNPTELAQYNKSKRFIFEEESSDEGKNFSAPITLKKLTLENIKCFKHVDIEFPAGGADSSWKLLVGDNGVGKTTILHCIALCALGPELASRLVTMPQNMLRLGTEKGYMEAVFEVPLHSGNKDNSTEDVVIRIGIEKGSRSFDIRVDENSPNADRVREFLAARKRTDFEGWFTAGYGAVRNLLFTDEPSRISPQDPVLDRVDSLFEPSKVLIDPASLYRFLSGDSSPFKEMGAPAKLSPTVLAHIRELLEKLLPMISFSGANGSGSLDTYFGKVPISELSEGYKSMLSWLAHLIIHLLRAVGWNGNINDVKGIVLIDEVDLHLHPSWQQQVIPFLRHSFPNLQFIGCTHSPMTAGGAEDGDIILLERNGEEITVKQDLPSIKGWRADQILTGPLFGLRSTRDISTGNMMKEYKKLLALSQRSPQEETRLKDLETKLGDTIPPTGETEMEREAFLLVEKTMEIYLNKQAPERKEKLLKEIKKQLKRPSRNVSNK